jgi:uncharacterized repeat protein (TIGR03803 family)
MKKLLLLSGMLLSSFFVNSQAQLWGMTRFGGANNYGTIFKTDGSGSNCTIQKDFIFAEGGIPQGALIQATDGKLYGLTNSGGASFSYGSIFQYDPIANIYTLLKKFNSTNGDGPKGSLLQTADGKMYGMTYYGGSNDVGVIFQYDPITNVLVKKMDFSLATGRYPAGSLIQATDGNLYGMTSEGGANGKGVLFQYNPTTNAYVKKIDFAGTTNGSNPVGSLIQASDGKLYGMTKLGGIYNPNSGVLFQYDPVSNVLTKKIDFTGTTGTAIGHMPTGSLMIANDGKMYGVTGGYPILFQYDFVNNIYTYKINLPPTPEGSLLQASDGKLYGTSIYGGVNGKGTIYQYDYNSNVLAIKTDFNATNANFPTISLIEISGSLNNKTNQLSKDFKIYPNPTSGVFNIEIDKNSIGSKATIYNLLGQKVKHFDLKSTTTNQYLNKGIYLLEIEKDGNTTSKKLIVN